MGTTLRPWDVGLVSEEDSASGGYREIKRFKAVLYRKTYRMQRYRDATQMGLKGAAGLPQTRAWYREPCPPRFRGGNVSRGRASTLLVVGCLPMSPRQKSTDRVEKIGRAAWR